MDGWRGDKGKEGRRGRREGREGMMERESEECKTKTNSHIEVSRSSR